MANLALARKLAELFWRLMVHGITYVEKGLKKYEEKLRELNNICSKNWRENTTWSSSPKRPESHRFTESGRVPCAAATRRYSSQREEFYHGKHVRAPMATREGACASRNYGTSFMAR